VIDPRTAPWYNRTDNELEEILIFCVLVAGKNAMNTARGLDFLLTGMGLMPGDSPFALLKLRTIKDLIWWLRGSGIGCYNIKSKTIKHLLDANLDLKTCSIADLQAIPGIGPKTARFFVLHTRPGAQVACLDTHILKFLAKQGFKVPKSTPSGKRYLELEKAYLDLCEENSWDPAQKDIEIWKLESGH
jgi:thermostable 8-oxoguanine DNA glycosylase